MKKTTLFAFLSLFLIVGLGVGSIVLNTGPNVTKVVETVKDTATTKPVTVETNFANSNHETAKMTISIVMTNADDAESVDKVDFIIKNSLIKYISELTKEDILNPDLEEQHKEVLKKDLEEALYLDIQEVMITELNIVTPEALK